MSHCYVENTSPFSDQLELALIKTALTECRVMCDRYPLPFRAECVLVYLQARLGEGSELAELIAPLIVVD